MSPRRRRAIVSALLLIYIPFYIALAAMLGEAVNRAAPGWPALLFYAAAGIAWVGPLYPLFRWMNAAPIPPAPATNE